LGQRMQTGASALSFRVFIQIIQAGNTEISARNPGTIFNIRAGHSGTVQLWTRGERAHYAHREGM